MFGKKERAPFQDTGPHSQTGPDTVINHKESYSQDQKTQAVSVTLLALGKAIIPVFNLRQWFTVLGTGT